jgi:hypothetical protein
MSNSDKYRLRVRINQDVPDINMTLINGVLETVYKTQGREFNLLLPKGVYQLKLQYLNYYQEKFFSIDDDFELQLDLDYPFTPPALNYKTTHKYYSEAAEWCSYRVTYGEHTVTPNFFFFAALYFTEKQAIGHPAQWAKSYRIFNIDKTTDILFEFNSIIDVESGMLCFSAVLEPGLYFLSYTGNPEHRIFPIYIFENYQTQFFVRYTEYPDFVNSRIFFAYKEGFHRADDKYVLLEKIICSFSDFKNFKWITNEDIEGIKKHPYLVALVNILFQSMPPNILDQYGGNEQTSPVTECKFLQLPDMGYCNQGESYIFSHSGEPPVVSFLLTKYLHQPDNEKLLFEPASILDRIVDNLNYDIFWTNFSAIDEPEIWSGTYKNLLQTIGESSNPLIRKITRAKNAVFNVPNSQVEESLKYLVGRISLTNEQMDSLSETLGKIKDVSEMSKEFGLPPTSILRNYQKYVGYYIKIKEPDPSKRQEKNNGRNLVVLIMVCASLALLTGLFSIFQTNSNSDQPVSMEGNVNDMLMQYVSKNDIPIQTDESGMTAIQLDIVKNRSLSKAQKEAYLAKSKAADTISKYVNLTVLLNTYDSIGKQLDKDRNNIVAANDFFKINTKLLQVIREDSGYLASRLSSRDLDSLNKSLKKFIVGYDSVRTLPGIISLPIGDFKTASETFEPMRIKGRLDDASREILKKIN